MPRHSRAGSSGPASKTPNRRAHSTVGTDVPKFPHHVREKIPPPYVHGNVLDLSKASEFYRKEAAVAVALTDYVECLPRSRYRLKNGFDVFFHGSLPKLLANHPAQPADALADSLFRLAQAWAEIKHVDSLPGDRRSTSNEVLNDEWKQSWNRMQENDWDAFRRMSSPLAQYIVTALDEGGKIDHGLCYQPTARRIELGISFAQDVRQPPEMRILIKGNPAVDFMIAYIRKSQGQRWPRSKKKDLENLRMIFDATVSTVAKEFLGLIKPTTGRPRDIGERAAYLLYHERIPIYSVSRELCSLRQEPNHICGAKCSDKIKKAAGNHFKHLKRELQSLILSR
jgi:hypothetical protein